jgi:hypothetical protein
MRARIVAAVRRLGDLLFWLWLVWSAVEFVILWPLIRDTWARVAVEAAKLGGF